VSTSARRPCCRSAARPRFVAKTAKDKLDGVRLVGAQPFATFQSAIDTLLKVPALASGKGN